MILDWPRSLLDISITSDGKTRANFLANPVYLFAVSVWMCFSGKWATCLIFLFPIFCRLKPLLSKPILDLHSEDTLQMGKYPQPESYNLGCRTMSALFSPFLFKGWVWVCVYLCVCARVHMCTPIYPSVAAMFSSTTVTRKKFKMVFGMTQASLIAQLLKNPPAMQETPVWFWVGKIHWRRDRLPTLVFLGFPCGSAGKESTCNAGDLGLIPGLGRSPGEGKGYPLQYSGLENSMYCMYSPWGHKESDVAERLSLTWYDSP